MRTNNTSEWAHLVAREGKVLIIRPIHADSHDIVEIIWRDHDTGQQLRERRSAPPEEVWKARQDADAGDTGTPKGTPDAAA